MTKEQAIAKYLLSLNEFSFDVVQTDDKTFKSNKTNKIYKVYTIGEFKSLVEQTLTKMMSKPSFIEANLSADDITTLLANYTVDVYPEEEFVKQWTAEHIHDVMDYIKSRVTTDRMKYMRFDDVESYIAVYEFEAVSLDDLIYHEDTNTWSFNDDLYNNEAFRKSLIFCTTIFFDTFDEISFIHDRDTTAVCKMVSELIQTNKIDVYKLVEKLIEPYYPVFDEFYIRDILPDFDLYEKFGNYMVYRVE